MNGLDKVRVSMSSVPVRTDYAQGNIFATNYMSNSGPQYDSQNKMLAHAHTHNSC